MKRSQSRVSTPIAPTFPRSLSRRRRSSMTACTRTMKFVRTGSQALDQPRMPIAAVGVIIV